MHHKAVIIACECVHRENFLVGIFINQYSSIQSRLLRWCFSRAADIETISQLRQLTGFHRVENSWEQFGHEPLPHFVHDIPGFLLSHYPSKLFKAKQYIKSNSKPCSMIESEAKLLWPRGLHSVLTWYSFTQSQGYYIVDLLDIHT